MQEDNKDFNPENMPQEGTPEFDAFMRQYYGDDYELGYRVSFWKRAGAYIIDIILLGIISLIVIFNNENFIYFVDMYSGSTNFFDEKMMEEFSVISLEIAPIMAFVSFLYFSLEIFFAQSIGKMILGLKIGSEDRTNANLYQLLLRFFAKNFDTVLSLLMLITSVSFLSFFETLVSFVIFFGYFMVFRRERQALHDLPGKTTVFHKNAIKN